MKGRGATMPFLTELGEVLHEEHFRILSLICGLENRVIERRRPIDPRYEDEKEHLQGAHRLRWNSSEARDGSPSCVIRLSDPAVDPRLKRAWKIDGTLLSSSSVAALYKRTDWAKALSDRRRFR
jgi:hypothetical protein